MKQNEFGKNLRELRLSNNFTQKQLGEKLGVCNQTISFWEIGSREPDLDTLKEIAVIFDVSVDTLLN